MTLHNYGGLYGDRSPVPEVEEVDTRKGKAHRIVNKTILVIASHPKSLILFRGPLIRELIGLGYKIIACAPGNDNSTSSKLNALGIRYCNIPLKRQGFNIFHDIQTIFHLVKLIQFEKPGIILGYTIKPVIYGSLAAHYAGVKNIYSIITGIGYTLYDETPKQKAIGLIVRKLYRFALQYNKKVFFQNPDDLDYFWANKLIGPEEKSIIVNGSGVDLDHYKKCPPILSPITFLLISRLLKEKGIIEFAEAAKRLKMKYPDTNYQLIGWIDDSPSAISASQVDRWEDEGTIEYLGFKEDVRPFIEKTSIYVLPSYREGTPRTVLEAMAMGRPIITTDAPGCRETVEHGRNGFLIPIKNSEALAKAMEQFIRNSTLVEKMGKESRKIAEEKYDVYKINKVIMNAMDLI